MNFNLLDIKLPTYQNYYNPFYHFESTKGIKYYSNSKFYFDTEYTGHVKADIYSFSENFQGYVGIHFTGFMRRGIVESGITVATTLENSETFIPDYLVQRILFGEIVVWRPYDKFI
jgi:hypothetical protein